MRLYVRDGKGRFSRTAGRKVDQSKLKLAAKALDEAKGKRKEVSQGDIRRLSFDLARLETRSLKSALMSTLKSELAALPDKTPATPKTPASPKAPATPKTPATPPVAPGSAGVTPTFPTKKDGRIANPPSSRDLAKAAHLDIDPTTGKVKIWEGTKHSLKNNKGYVEGRDHDYVYAPLTSDGNRRVINKDGQIKATYQGEVVHGVPNHPNVYKMKDSTLFNALADRMSRVETQDRGKTASGAPRVNGDRFEIHHIHQWAKRDFAEINLAVDQGKMTLIQAQAEARTLLQPNPSIRTGYDITLAPKGARELIVLRGSMHTGANYDLNHPMLPHPDTGKLTKFGIPKGKEEGGREWFNQWRDSFWQGYNRVEAYSIAKEVERRIKDGRLTPTQAKDLWNQALEKQEKDYAYQEAWRQAHKAQGKKSS